MIENRTARGVRLRGRFGVNLLAVSRQGRPMKTRLHTMRLRAGDVLLLQGPVDQMPTILGDIGCLPLAERGLTSRMDEAYAAESAEESAQVTGVEQ